LLPIHLKPCDPFPKFSIFALITNEVISLLSYTAPATVPEGKSDNA
jgi:hypothetical protein